MKAVMISIQPKWVEKILNGEKTIEVRKTRPKLDTPFKCYIYCTEGQQLLDMRLEKYWEYSSQFIFTEGKSNGVVLSVPPMLNRKVIGEFVCDRIEMVNAKCSDYGIDLFYHDCITEGCLTENEVEKYFNIPEDKDLRVMKGNGYAWHISDLKIYDQPKELTEFNKPCYGLCGDCIYGGGNCEGVIETAPQSWCYVAKLKGE